MKIPWRITFGTVKANLKSPQADSGSGVALIAGYGRVTVCVGARDASRSRTALSTARGAIGVMSTAEIALSFRKEVGPKLMFPLIAS